MLPAKRRRIYDYDEEFTNRLYNRLLYPVGAHLLLFFLAFVFGSFCTFCFHMLMYLFDEKCVLFPKLLSLSSTRHNVIYEFIPNNKEVQDLPVDFLSTQWVEKNACTLPTYVPLLSGIFGLVWTTMFLMCSTGSRTLTGLQRPWRVLPPVFLFSLAMGSLCVYSSAVTHYGLQELCYKLGEITGSSTCTYTVNVATLAYERRIRGVYQATRLTILTAWLHTACWILSALLALARVLLAVDFQLVRVNVDLRGDIDKMLQRHEQQIRTVSPDPDLWINEDNQSIGSHNSTRVHFRRKNRGLNINDELVELQKKPSDLLFFSKLGAGTSELSLVPSERKKLDRLPAYNTVSKDKRFIVDILYDILDSISVAEMLYQSASALSSSSSLSEADSESTMIVRQIGQQKISSKTDKKPASEAAMSAEEAEELASEIKQMLQMKLNNQLIELFSSSTSLPPPSTPKTNPIEIKSAMNIADDLRILLELVDAEKLEKEIIKQEISSKKSNLKSVGIQTDKPKGRVKISKSATNFSGESVSEMQEDNVSSENDKTDVSEETDDEKRVGDETVIKNKDLDDIKTEDDAQADDDERAGEETVIKNIDLEVIKTENDAQVDSEKHDGDEVVDTEKVVNVEVEEKDLDRVCLEREDNAGFKITEDIDIEDINIDQLAFQPPDFDLEVAKRELLDTVIHKEDDDGTVAKKDDLDETVIKEEDVDLQDDTEKFFIIDIDKDKVDDEVVSSESSGDVSVTTEEEVASQEDDANKQTQTKPKEKQD